MHVWPASGQIQLQSNVFSMHFVCLLGLTDFLGYSQLSICSLHKYLSWETAPDICSKTYMPMFIVWQWYPLFYFPYARRSFQFLCSTATHPTPGLPFFTSQVNPLCKAPVETPQPVLKMKSEMQQQEPTKAVRVPRRDSSKQREHTNIINCHSYFSRNCSTVIRNRCI